VFKNLLCPILYGIWKIIVQIWRSLKKAAFAGFGSTSRYVEKLVLSRAALPDTVVQAERRCEYLRFLVNTVSNHFLSETQSAEVCQPWCRIPSRDLSQVRNMIKLSPYENREITNWPGQKRVSPRPPNVFAPPKPSGWIHS